MFHRSILPTLILLACLQTATAQMVGSSNPCKKNYETARAAYEIGNFQQVLQLLKPCADPEKKDGTDIQTRIDALELVTLAYIAKDQLDSARENIRMILELDPVFIQNSQLQNVVFDEIMSAIRTEDMESKVSSVTKKPEDIRMASAHIRLIKRQEIIDRGYIDIVDLLSDLPGFHISRAFGQAHANAYQLGYRQENPERTLLMVDGVEENDLWSNWAYLSRQYPLSNIKAVEVIYGPASVMYGPRAFVGAINIITLEPKDLARDALMPISRPERYKNVQLYGNVMNGGFNTRSGDMTLQIRGSSENTKLSKFAMQLTARYYESDEHDMSDMEFFDYDSTDITNRKNYSHLNLTNPAGRNILNQYVSTFRLDTAISPYYRIIRDASGNVQAINITPEGEKRARALDLKAYRDSVNGAPIGFSNTTRDMYIGTKIRIEDLQFGFSLWRLREGNGIFQDINEAGSANGSIWEPIKATMYMKLEKRFFNGLTLTNLSSFILQRLGRETARVNFISFLDPKTPLHFAHLVNPDSTYYSVKGLSVAQQPGGGSSGQYIVNFDLANHGWKNRYMFYQAQQARTETRLFYEARKWDFSGGLDLRSTLMQGDYLIYEDFLTRYTNPAAYRAKQDRIALAREKGIVESTSEGGNQYAIFDAGLYTMFNFRIIPSFRASIGSRADMKIIRSSELNIVATPRIALIYYKPGFSIKFTGSSGYQGVSQAVKYSSGMGTLPNPYAQQEQINYADLSVGGSIRPKRMSSTAPPVFEYDFSAYAMKVTQALGLANKVVDADTFLIYDNIGQFRILGGLGSLAWQPVKGLRLDANWTYTLAFQTSNTAAAVGRAPRLLVGDIARNMGNVSATYIARNIGPFNVSLNLRGNYVSNRPVGLRTTQSLNYGLDTANRGRIPAYFVCHGNLGVSFGNIARIDLTVQNLFDRNLLEPSGSKYYHPGIGDASGNFNMPWYVEGSTFANRSVPFIPQRGRFMLLKLTVNLYSSVKSSK